MIRKKVLREGECKFEMLKVHEHKPETPEMNQYP